MHPVQVLQIGAGGMQICGQTICLPSLRGETSLITDKRAEEAFERLRDTVAEIGAAKSELERTEILRKRARRRQFLTAPAGTVAEREAYAETAPDVGEADERYVKAVQEYESLKAMRELETIALEVWRTECANRRRA